MFSNPSSLSSSVLPGLRDELPVCPPLLLLPSCACDGLIGRNAIVIEEPGGNIVPERTGNGTAEDWLFGMINFHEHHELWIGCWRVPGQRGVGIVCRFVWRRRGACFGRDLIARNQRLLRLAVDGGLHQH